MNSNRGGQRRVDPYSSGSQSGRRQLSGQRGTGRSSTTHSGPTESHSRHAQSVRALNSDDLAGRSGSRRHSDSFDREGRARSDYNRVSAPRSSRSNSGRIEPSAKKRSADNRALPIRIASFAWEKSKVFCIIVIAIVLIACAILIDAITTQDKIYKGVTVGDVDVSGMTVEAASEAINDTYLPRLYATSVYIFADEETANSADVDMQIIESDALAEQLSFEEAQANKKLWITSAQALEAALPSNELAQTAFKVGRENGLFERLSALFGGHAITPYADFNETQLSNLIADINATLGTPVVDYGIKLNEGIAEVTEGSNGNVLNVDGFTSEINKQLLEDESAIKSFVANVEFAPYTINYDMARATCDAVNAVLPESVVFDSGKGTITFNRSSIGEWIVAEKSQRGETPYLNPSINKSSASKSVLAQLNNDDANGVTVRFGKDNGEVYVQPDSEVELPNIDGALTEFDDGMFASYRESGNAPDSSYSGTIPITTESYSGRLTLDDALSYGLVSRFSMFTTQYTNTTSTANRTFNIHLMADRIHESIVESDGGVWSFNDIAGAADESNGFREAGVIAEGEYTTGIGGGICQVATTVFNAVYNSGLPVIERHNHTLYSASYPAGRDAAIAYPTMDLKWRNSTKSDILLRTSYTDTSITVALVGIPTNLNVSTETGEWEKGKKFSTKYVLEESLGKDASYVKTAGTDGMDITVIRTVRDSSGNVLEKDTFKSSYSPINRVIAYGPGSDLNAIKEKYAEPSEKKTSSSGETGSADGEGASTAPSSSGATSSSSSSASSSGGETE